MQRIARIVRSSLAATASEDGGSPKAALLSLFLPEALAFAPALLAYGALALWHLGLPGLYYDEAADAVPAMQLLLGQPVELFRQTGLQVFGKTLPLMAFDYVGAVHTYAALPFFALFDVGAVPLRLMTVWGGALTLGATYAWLRLLFHSRWVGGAAALLLATQPSFLFFTRQGVHVSSLMSLWAMLTLLALLAWQRTGRWPWLGTATFLLGLGLATKLLFLWVIIGLATIYLGWGGVRLLQWFRGPERALGLPFESPGALRSLGTRGLQLLGATATFALGMGMLILFNVQTPGTLETLLRYAGVSQYGVENNAYGANLLARLDNLRELLDGGHFWYLGGPFANAWYPAAFALGAGALVAVLVRDRAFSSYIPGAALLVALTLLVLLQSPFTLSGLWPTHLYILLPLLHGILALGYYLWATQRYGSMGVGVASLLVLLMTTSNLTVDLQYHEALAVTGGRRGFSDAINRLASHLDEAGKPQPIAMDWGMKYNVQLLTQGRVNPLEVFQYAPEPDASLRAWLRASMSTPEHVYLFHGVPDYIIYPRFQLFQEVVREAGKTTHLDIEIAERDGTPLYQVYSVR